MKTLRLLGLALIMAVLGTSFVACGGDDEDGSAGGSGNAPKSVEAVDLGLPSGTKWANMNVGAEKPEDYGLFFAWGETTGYTSVAKGSPDSDGSYTMTDHSFDWANYKWMNEGQWMNEGHTWKQINKYQIKDGQTNACWYDGTGNFIGDGELTLLPADDAAHVNWGGKWSMPTYDDIRELLDNTTNEWTTKNGVYGCRFTSKENENSIFLPAAGYRNDASLDRQSSYGYYWSASVSSESPNSFSELARLLRFNSNGYVRIYDKVGRETGCSVRPVLRK